jgi:hypothetical protein
MLAWLRERLRERQRARRPQARPYVAEPERPAVVGRSFAGPYLGLYTYLDRRFADTVVLTFAQIEDLLGFALPAAARVDAEWWTNASRNVVASPHSDCWTLAQRTAVPNLSAAIVSFARAI